MSAPDTSPATSGSALQALDSAIASHRAGELEEWELQLVRRRLEESNQSAEVTCNGDTPRVDALLREIKPHSTDPLWKDTERLIGMARQLEIEGRNMRRVIFGLTQSATADSKDALIRAALQEWHHGELPAVQALWAIYAIIWPTEVPNDDDLKWAQAIIAKRAAENAAASTGTNDALAEALACPRPQIMGEHACKNRKQCWEPCGDLGHHEEYAKAQKVCPHAAPHVYCERCPVSPCPLGLPSGDEGRS